jgi:hypothetical protein
MNWLLVSDAARPPTGSMPTCVSLDVMAESVERW